MLRGDQINDPFLAYRNQLPGEVEMFECVGGKHLVIENYIFLSQKGSYATRVFTYVLLIF
jgi:hypothetical protein